MADMYAVPGDALTAIADAIRLKRDTTTPLSVDDMPLEIGLIDGGGGLEFLGECTVDMSIGTYGTLYVPLPVDLPENTTYIIKAVRGTISTASTVRNPYWIILSRDGVSGCARIYTGNWQAVNTMGKVDPDTGVAAITSATANIRFSVGNRYMLYKTTAYSEED